jgi:hypothetical protein
MKVYFNGFWCGFFERIDPINVDFFIKFLTDIFNEEIEISHNVDDADILMETVFTNRTFINYKNWKTSFLLTGESFYAPFMLENLSSYTCILGFNETIDNYVEFPFYIAYSMSLPHIDFPPVNIVPNNSSAAVISNGNLNARTTFLDKLEKRMNVLYGGSYKNNIGGKLQGNFASDNLLNFYKISKFAITMENTKIGHYITEKIINGFRAGTIPIYWGSQHVTKYFNSKRFIILEDTSDSSINAVIDRMVNMSDEEYLQIVNEPIFNEGMNIDNVYNNAVNNIKKLVFKDNFNIIK